MHQQLLYVWPVGELTDYAHEVLHLFGFEDVHDHLPVDDGLAVEEAGVVDEVEAELEVVLSEG